MTYPILPMAIVTFLAGVSEQRSELPKGPKQVSVLAHHDKSVRALRFAVEVDMHWSEVVEKSVQMANDGPVDTMTVIYPADGTDPVDFGIILEAHRKPFVFEWTYSPKFDIRLAPDNVIASLKNGIGVETLQKILDTRNPSTKLGGIPFINEKYMAGSGKR